MPRKMLENLPSTILTEICLYLTRSEVWPSLSHSSKFFHTLVNSDEFSQFWVRSRLGIPFSLSLSDLSCISKDFYNNQILNFHAWCTTGGVSDTDLKNSYQNMWTYSPESYSTYYQEFSTAGLVKNVCCSAYFAGEFQKKKFKKFFYSDLFQMIYNEETIPERFLDFDSHDVTKVFVLDPIGDRDESVEEYCDTVDFTTSYHYRDVAVVADPKLIPADQTPIIKKIAVARPYFFTGAVRSLVLILSRNRLTKDYSEFDRYNDVNCYEVATRLGTEVRHENNEEYEFVEFKETEQEFYPAAWIMFKSMWCNQVLVELKNCHFAKFACVKMIEIDDRRRDYDLERMQPNYDIMYFLLVGSILADESIRKKI
jgi:hypothetical protein